MPEFTHISHLDLTVRDVEASARWYELVLGLRRVRRAEFPDRTMVVLRHEPSGLIVGLNQHAAGSAEPFHESVAGLDHIGFAVADRAAIEAWLARFEELAVEHSPVATTARADVLVFRDPDNIQLEMYAPRPEPVR